MTCRCPLCGEKNAGKNKNRRLYHSHNLGRDEFGYSWDADSRDNERRLLRRRMAQKLDCVISEQLDSDSSGEEFVIRYEPMKESN